MAVITISREFGTGGRVLAEDVARALGYHLVDRSFIGAVLCQYGMAEFDAEYEKVPGFWESLDLDKADRRETMVHLLDQVVRAVACHGDAVILGRSSYAILRGLGDALHVRLQAPFADRVDRTCARFDLSADAAAALVKEKDRIRRFFVEAFYHVPGDATHAFDLVINTAVVPVDLAARWVLEAARLPRHAANQPTTRDLEVDKLLQRAVVDRLHCALEHH